MKKSLFLYLFVFSFIINIFLLVNDGKVLKGKTQEIEQLKKDTDSLTMYRNMYREASYFSIDENLEAQKKFKDYDVQEVMKKVQNDLTVLNTQPHGNPILPQATDGSKSIIYKVTVLNHKWIIAAYKNDSESGELLIEYTFNPDDFTTFNVITHTVY